MRVQRCCFALYSFFLLTWTGPASGQTPIGYLDGATCKYAGGWARAPDSNDPISVHLWFDNNSNWVRGTTANLYRADVGNHAFHFNYDESLQQMLCDGGSHQVAAYGIWGSNPELGASPKTVSCGYFVKTGSRYNCCPSPDMVIDSNGNCSEATYFKEFDRYTSSTTIVNMVLDVSAYCPADNMCVDKDSACVTQYTAGRLSSSNVHEKISYCGGGSNPDAWIDCDYSSGRCNKCGTVATTAWIEAGEAVVGEYGAGNGGSGSTECCGDDRNEFVISGNGMTACCNSPTDTLDANGNCKAQASGYTQHFKSYGGPVCNDVTDARCVNGGDDTSDTAVCTNNEYCVYDGDCFVQGTPADLSGDGRKDGWCMTSDNHKGKWRDCDNSSSQCAGKCLSVWSAGGEDSPLGEYNSGTALECCGDDEGEYYTSYDGRFACCNSPDDIIDSSGSCVAQAAPTGSEILGRGLICLPADGGVYCGWRLLRWDGTGAVFNLYRSSSAGGPFALVNGNPVTGSTNYLDTSAVSGSTYYYRVAAVVNATERPHSQLSKVTAGASRNYLQVGLTSNDTISKVMTGDLNADGVLDFVAVSPYSIGRECTGRPFQIEGLISGNGTWSSRWLTSTGYVPSGYCQHQTVLPAAVWDLDGDLRAEVITRWSGDGNQLAVLDGATGSVRATIPWPYQDGSANRNLLVIAYLADVNGDGVADPHIVVQRGLYAGAQRFVAYFFEEGTSSLVIKRDVVFDDNTPRGTHGLPAADVDNDGKDEIIACGTALDDDFSTLYSANLCHNDACFPADIRPDLPGLEVFMGEEGCNRKARLFDATGQALWSETADPFYRGGWERGWCADITTAHAGLECYAYELLEGEPDHWYAHIFAADGVDITTQFMSESQRSTNFGSTRWPMDWDHGEGLKELYNYCNAPGVAGCGWYSSWPGDILGDAREEAVVFGETGFFRVYTNTGLNNERHITKLDDRGYRAAISRVGVGYNTNFIPEKTNQARTDVLEPGT